jgi:Bax protein
MLPKTGIVAIVLAGLLYSVQASAFSLFWFGHSDNSVAEQTTTNKEQQDNYAIKVYPIDTQDMPANMAEISNQERKQLFVDILLPLILLSNQAISEERSDLVVLFRGTTQQSDLSGRQIRYLKVLAKKYKVKYDPQLGIPFRQEMLSRIDIIPVDLALAQAANESAWGRSRFARDARNIFGIWTWNPKLGLAPKRRDKGSRHYVRKFNSLGDSVAEYMRNLNTHRAYSDLRRLRASQRLHGQPLSGELLASGLLSYSTRGKDYVSSLRIIISSNQFDRYNNATLVSSLTLASL